LSLNAPEIEIKMKRPTELVKAVYREHIERFGEPEKSIRYDSPPSNDTDIYPSFIDVMVWPPEEDLIMTTFSTIGMSEKPMVGAEHRVELHFSIAEKLNEDLIGKITIFLANLSLYPFMNSTYFDWWHTLPNVGQIPGYESTTSLLLHPAFVKDGWDIICKEGTNVKILNVVPITKEEQVLSKEKGINDLIDYLYDNEISYFDRR
jgi:hypothetical protein